VTAESEVILTGNVAVVAAVLEVIKDLVDLAQVE
jgi:hypothetical protein